jgi:GNAT superfamily N-acetyltransferase
MSVESFRVQTELTKAQMLQAYVLVKQLNPKMSEAEYAARLEDMWQYPYRMMGVFEGTSCIAVAGYWVMTKLYCGKYLELDNVVVDETHRSRGIGKVICEVLQEIAYKENCEVMMLDAYIPNTRAHEFYEQLGFAKKGYHFVKKLSA